MIPDILDLDRRFADLERLIGRWHEEREEQRNDAQREQDDADALADAIDAGDCDEFGEPIPYDTYRSA